MCFLVSCSYTIQYMYLFCSVHGQGQRTNTESEQRQIHFQVLLSVRSIYCGSHCSFLSTHCFLVKSFTYYQQYVFCFQDEGKDAALESKFFTALGSRDTIKEADEGGDDVAFEASSATNISLYR